MCHDTTGQLRLCPVTYKETDCLGIHSHLSKHKALPIPPTSLSTNLEIPLLNLTNPNKDVFKQIIHCLPGTMQIALNQHPVLRHLSDDFDSFFGVVRSEVDELGEGEVYRGGNAGVEKLSERFGWAGVGV